MNDNLKTEYLKAREHGAWHGPISAAQAIIRARYELRMKGANYPRYAGDSETLELPRGESIVMSLDYDNDSSVDERNAIQIESVHYDSYSDIFANAPDYWQDRENNVYCRGDRAFERFIIRADSDTLGGYGNLGRHRAWLAQRAQMDAIAETVRESLRDGYVNVTVELRDKFGNVIDSESIGGYEATGDYAGREAWDMAQLMREQRARHWQKETEKARARAAKMRHKFHAIAQEMKTLRGIDAPASCAALRESLRDIKNAHAMAVSTICEGH